MKNFIFIIFLPLQKRLLNNLCFSVYVFVFLFCTEFQVTIGSLTTTSAYLGTLKDNLPPQCLEDRQHWVSRHDAHRNVCIILCEELRIKMVHEQVENHALLFISFYSHPLFSWSYYQVKFRKLTFFCYFSSIFTII